MKAASRALHRREFIQGAGLALVAPYVLTSRALGAPNEHPASERITVGLIGLRGVGRRHLGRALALRHFQVRGCCDVDKKILSGALSLARGGTKRRVLGWGDFRRMLDAKDIDAVIIATPDHWHALISIYACRAGKDVYCEKPLSLTIREGRRMVEAVRRYGRVFQTGTQHRSKHHTRFACELVRSGRIGKLHTIRTGIPYALWPPPPVPNSAPPPQLDYDMWLGPAPARPYNAKRVHQHFRCFWDYSGGQMTNHGHHANDLAQWGNGTELTGPISVEGRAWYEPHGWYEVPMRSEATFEYANGVRLICGLGSAARFQGSDGEIYCGYGSLKASRAELLTQPIGPNDVHLYRSTDHHGNWAECIKSRKLPICDVEIGHRTVTLCHLANIAIRLGRKIRWDPDKEEILNDEEATRMLHRAYRAPWSL